MQKIGHTMCKLCTVCKKYAKVFIWYKIYASLISDVNAFNTIGKVHFCMCMCYCIYICICMKQITVRYWKSTVNASSCTYKFILYLLVKHLPFNIQSRSSNGPWTQSLNNWPWPVWMFATWFSTDSHFATLRGPSSPLDCASQYMWFVMECCHGRTTSQSFCLANLSSFLDIPIN